MNEHLGVTECGGCGTEIPDGASICASCGWDLTTAVVQPQRRSLWGSLAAGGWRVLLFAVLLSVPVLGFIRLQQFGPGPDLETTMRWIAIGDDGRSAELVTMHRAYEIGTAVSRFAVRELEPPSFGEGWDETVAPFATMNVRGWIPMLFIGASTDTAPASVREIYRVSAEDGWGRPYRVSTRLLVRGTDWTADAEVASDLEIGLQESFFTTGQPDFEAADYLRLRLESAGRDGDFDTADDLVMVSYVPVGFTMRLNRNAGDLQRQLDQAFDVGRHYFRFDGARYDLIDARMLAEYRMETLS